MLRRLAVWYPVALMWRRFRGGLAWVVVGDRRVSVSPLCASELVEG
jgi:hypothetical protein